MENYYVLHKYAQQFVKASPFLPQYYYARTYFLISKMRFLQD